VVLRQCLVPSRGWCRRRPHDPAIDRAAAMPIAGSETSWWEYRYGAAQRVARFRGEGFPEPLARASAKVTRFSTTIASSCGVQSW